MTTARVRRRVLPASVVCTMLLAAGCGGAASAPPPATEPGPPAYAAVLQPQLEALAKDLLVTGAVVMVRSPERGDWTMTYGTRTYKGNDPVQVGDHVRVGSNTKPMTGTVILQLVQEGKLSLEDPVSKFRPDVPNGANITIRQLMEMRSGLYNYSTAPELNRAQDSTPERVYTPDELLAMAFERPPLYRPGQGWNYSNTNFVLLGLIIEKLTGRTAAEEFQSRIFGPLGMTGSTLPAATDASIPDPHPHGYTYGTNVQTIDTNVLPENIQAQAKAATLAPMDVTTVNPSWAWTAGSANSTAGDLVTFVQALGGGGLLSPAMQKQRLDSMQPTVPGNPASPGYGLALAKLGSLYGHTGEIPGYNSFMGYDPDRKITVVVWATNAPSPNGDAPATELAKVIISNLYGS
ncbi:MAG: beta-lactamase [Pseudonocardia sp.]|jgi:D-alanyl-D-alanine carboxypeptidase|nr:beta-lactamase [Pseudonocardia sp.]